jgi:hypothetical protein
VSRSTIIPRATADRLVHGVRLLVEPLGDLARLERLQVVERADLPVPRWQRRDELLEREVDDDGLGLIRCGVVEVEQLALLPPRLVPAPADPSDHGVDDDAERVAAVAVPARLELAPQPLAHGLADVLPDRASHLRDAHVADRLHPARKQELDLPVLQQSVVLCIPCIAHREASRVRHGEILRAALRQTA